MERSVIRDVIPYRVCCVEPPQASRARSVTFWNLDATAPPPGLAVESLHEARTMSEKARRRDNEVLY